MLVWTITKRDLLWQHTSFVFLVFCDIAYNLGGYGLTPMDLDNKISDEMNHEKDKCGTLKLAVI